MATVEREFQVCRFQSKFYEITSGPDLYKRKRDSGMQAYFRQSHEGVLVLCIHSWPTIEFANPKHHAERIDTNEKSGAD